MIVGAVMKPAGSERAELSARTAVAAVSEHERLQSGSELVPDPGDPPVAVRGYGSARPSAGNGRPYRPIRRRAPQRRQSLGHSFRKG